VRVFTPQPSSKMITRPQKAIKVSAPAQVQPCQLRDVLDREDLNQSLYPSLQSSGESVTRLNPAKLFCISATTVMAVHPMDGNIQPDSAIQDVSIPDAFSASLVNQSAIAVASPTPRGMVRINRKREKQGSVCTFGAGIHNTTFPEGHREHRMKHDREE